LRTAEKGELRLPLRYLPERIKVLQAGFLGRESWQLEYYPAKFDAGGTT
jgi:hypothetical protein